MPHYKRKHLQATKNKIDSVNKQRFFFKRNFWKVVGFGIFIVLYAPNYKGQDALGNIKKSAVETEYMPYWRIVFLYAAVYLFFCLLAHYIWEFQDKRKLNKLNQLKEKLEKELDIKI